MKKSGLLLISFLVCEIVRSVETTISSRGDDVSEVTGNDLFISRKEGQGKFLSNTLFPFAMSEKLQQQGICYPNPPRDAAHPSSIDNRRVATVPDVIVYNRQGCPKAGGSVYTVTFPVSNGKGNCNYCWDSCYEKFDQVNQDSHGKIQSIKIPAGWVALAYSECLGSFGTEDPASAFNGVLDAGCHSFGELENVHFVFATETQPGKWEIMGEDVKQLGDFSGDLSSAHWGAGPTASGAANGVSYYSYMFRLLDPKQKRMYFQVGIGGTWIKPVMSWKRGDPCFCHPNGSWVKDVWGESCPKRDKLKCTNGCCGTDGCNGAFQTLEGGAGYWLGKLPTSQPKWTFGPVTECYDSWTNSPLDVKNNDDVLCSELGVISVSNRLLIPPDGVAFQDEGMLGQAWINSSIGKTRKTDRRRSLTLIMDTKNFKGPVAYILPHYYGKQGKWKDINGKYQPTQDFGNTQLEGGGWAFEYNAVPLLGRQTSNKRVVKMPRMRIGLNNGDRTVLITGYKSWNDNHFGEAVEKVLSGRASVLKTGSLFPLKGGIKHACDNEGSHNAALSFEGKTYNIGGQIFTRLEGGDCVGGIQWNEKAKGLDCSSETHCKFAEAFQLTDKSISYNSNTQQFNVQHGKMVPLSQVPDALKDRSYPEDHNDIRNPVRYNRAGISKICGGKAARSNAMFCRRSSAGDWIGFRWYRYVDQPGLQRLKLSSAEKKWLQARIVRLHRAMAKKSPLAKWLKPPTNLPKLVRVDKMLLVKPPTGMSVGYVPIVVYQGMDKPKGCCRLKGKECTKRKHCCSGKCSKARKCL